MTEEEKSAILANEGLWWDVGSALYESSEILLRPDAGFSEVTVVGEGVAGRVSPSNDYYRWRRSLIADMMYAFAVEDWLKGLLVAAYDRASKEKRAEINRALSALVPEDAEDYIEAILNALETPEMAMLAAEHERQRGAENSLRASALKEHGRSHDLLRLGQAAGLGLDEDLRGYLWALGIVNQLGRYPMHNREHDADLEPYVGNESLKERLNQAIHARYVELRYPAS